MILIKDIFYRPNLQRQQSYYSDGDIEDTQLPSLVSVQPVQKTVTALKRNIEDIKKVLILVPGEMSKPISSVLLSVEFLLTLIDTDKYDEVLSSGDKDYIVSENERPDYKPVTTISVSDLLSKNYSSKKIDTDQLSKIERVKRDYYKSLCSIANYYMDQLKQSLTEYNVNIINNLGLAEEDLNFLEKNFTSSYNELVKELDKNVGHIADYLNKSRIIKDQKLRMCNKLFNDRQSLTHVKSLELSKELVLRYCQNEKTNDYDFDTILVAQTILEENKLDKKLQEYYKYLNSSVILVDECLKMHVKEGILKKKLEDKKEKNS